MKDRVHDTLDALKSVMSSCIMSISRICYEQYVHNIISDITGKGCYKVGLHKNMRGVFLAFFVVVNI